MIAEKSVHVLITGRVQGVGYRAWVRDKACFLGLSGWVRNRRSSAVEAVFCGSADHVEDMLQACRTGPRWARVDGLEILSDAEPVTDGFLVRDTV